MAFEFHGDKQAYFSMQYENSKTSILPFLEEHIKISPETKVLEIGCAEAGVLKAFTDLGAQCTGIELAANRIELAREFMKDEVEKGLIDFITRDIYDIDVDKDLKWKYDLIILKDVIEHIHDQARFISRLGDFLNPGGVVFFGFPPWYMPFGGHQQVCNNKLLSKLPYYHLFPSSVYKLILKTFGETDLKVEKLLEVKETGISTSQFEEIVTSNNFKIVKEKFFLVSPIYKYKFKLQPKEQSKIISSIPFVRDFLTSAAYYLIKKTI